MYYGDTVEKQHKKKTQQRFQIHVFYSDQMDV